MEIAGTGEALSDEARSDGFSVFLDELTIRFLRKDQLRETGDDQGINDPQQDGRCDRHQDRGNQVFLHGYLPYARPTWVIRMSMTLIPMKGTMMPPAP